MRPAFLMAVVYFSFTRLALTAIDLHPNAGSLWPASGVAFAALILYGMHLWKGILAGAFLAMILTDATIPAATLMAVGNTLEAVVGAWLALRVLDFHKALDRPRDVIVLFIPVALVTSLISASLGIGALFMDGAVSTDSALPRAIVWWLGDALGIAIIAPLILTWHVRLTRGPEPSGVRDWFLLIPCLAALLAFGTPPTLAWIQNLAEFSIFVVGVWCALIVGRGAVALASLVISIIVIAGTSLGLGPYTELPAIYSSIVQQGYIYALALMMMILCAARIQQQQSNLQLQESETRFRTLWETTNDVVLVIDDHGIIQFANPAAMATFGYAPAEMVGQHMAIVQPNYLVSPHSEGMQRYLTTGKKKLDWRGTETLAKHRDGREFPIELVFSEIPVNGRRGFAGFVRDISKRKEADHAMRRSQALFATVFEASPIPIAFSRLSDGRYVEANQACLDLFGYQRSEAVGKTTIELKLWPDLKQREQMMHLLKTTGVANSLDLQMQRSDGQKIDVLFSAHVIEFMGENCIIATIIDITNRKRDELERRLADERFARIFNSNPDAITISRLDNGVYIELNDAWTELSGFTRQELIGKGTIELGIWAIPAQRAELIAQLETHGRVREFEFQLRRKNGETADTLMTGEVIELHGERCLLAILVNVTERNRNTRRLQESEQRFSDVVDAAGEYVWETDAAGNYTYLSARIERVLGYAPAELVGKRPYEFMPVDEAERLKYWFDSLADADATIRNVEFVSITNDGRQIWQQVSGVPIFNSVGEIIGRRGTGMDITERKLAEQRIEELATRDALTQLPNRRLLTDRLSQGILSAQRSGGLIAALFIDLDRFKTINDSLGHTAGDELLKLVADRLQQLMRKGDTLARIGGDEFVVVLEALRVPEDAGAVAQKIIAALSEPCTIAGTRLTTSASVGISVFPGDAADGVTLVRNADMAMYFAKEHGRRNYQFYSEEMNARAVEKLTLENTLRRAIEREEFELYYHPKFSLADGQLVGVEALVRWNHPDLGVVGPGRFIPITEDTGLIVPLGEWVLNCACRQSRLWAGTFQRDIPIAVNLSVGQFNKGLTRTVQNALANAGMSPALLELEITESVLMKNVDENIDVLRGLSDLGVSIAIDDFGTGYSSLAYLRRFNVDTLKIDQSFVRDINTNLDDAAIVEAIIALGHSLKLTVVAEGVETEEQRRQLHELHCDHCQGFLFGEPLPAAQFEAQYSHLGA